MQESKYKVRRGMRNTGQQKQHEKMKKIMTIKYVIKNISLIFKKQEIKKIKILKSFKMVIAGMYS